MEAQLVLVINLPIIERIATVLNIQLLARKKIVYNKKKWFLISNCTYFFVFYMKWNMILQWIYNNGKAMHLVVHFAIVIPNNSNYLMIITVRIYKNNKTDHNHTQNNINKNCISYYNYVIIIRKIKKS